MAERSGWATWKFALAGVGGAWILIFGAQAVFGRIRPADYGTVRVLIPTVETALAMTWAVAMATMAFRRLDEFQQAAGRFAWYWGGSLGLAVSAVGYIFIALGGLHWLDPQHFGLGRELFRAFQIGYVLGIGFPVAGFLVARLWWQATRR